MKTTSFKTNKTINKARVLFLNPDRSHTCSFYRSAGVATNLSKQLGSNFTIDVVAWPDMNTDWEELIKYDIVMMQRPYNAPLLDFARRVKMLRIKLWLDFDDNLLTVTGENRAWPVFNDPDIQRCVKTLITLADVVSVTNEDLREAYLPYNKNIIVIPNAFNDGIFDINREIVERDKIVMWRGSDTHVFDIMNYTNEINKCTEEYPEYDFTYMGFNPWFLPTNKNIKFAKARDIIDYFAVLYNIHPAIMQIPLVDTNFNRCKSNIAFIEGSFAGAVCVIPHYWGNIPGTLQYKDKDTYYEALRSILAGEVDIKEMNKKAWAYVKKNLLLSKINTLRVKVILDLLK